MNEHQRAALKVERMSNVDIEAAWKALLQYDSKQEYVPGVMMDDWALLIATEISKRAAIERRKKMEADIKRLQELEAKFRLA
jgi:hypothetical protein